MVTTLDINGNSGEDYTNGTESEDAGKYKCNCCPYGYHIDLDFVDFSEQMLSEDYNVLKLKALTEKWRSSRQSRNILLGLQTSSENLLSLTSYNTSKDSRDSPIPMLIERTVVGEHNIFGPELNQAVKEFEEILARTSVPTVLFTFPDVEKFHTFPRNKGKGDDGKKDLGSNAGIVFHYKDYVGKQILPEESLLGIPETSPSIEALSPTCEAETTEKIVKEQLKRISTLERKLSSLAREKDNYIDMYEDEKTRRRHLENELTRKTMETERVISTPQKYTKDVGVGYVIQTRDVGISHFGPRKRSVGVGGGSFINERDSISPTGSLSGRRHRRTFEVGIQVHESDVSEKSDPPLLFVTEKRDTASQVELEHSTSAQKTQRNVGTMTTVSTRDVSLLAKPLMRDVALNTSKTLKLNKCVGTVIPPEIRMLSKNAMLDFDLNEQSLNQGKKSTDVTEPIGNLEKETNAMSSESVGSSEKLIVENVFETLDDTACTKSTSTFTPPIYKRSDTYTKEIFPEEESLLLKASEETKDDRTAFFSGCVESKLPITETSCGSVDERESIKPSSEMYGALKVLNDAILRGKTTEHVNNAIGIVLHEWFRVAGSKSANPHDVEEYLDLFERYSPELLKFIVNMPCGNGNSAIHYAISHGNFDVVSVLMDSKCCDINRPNNAGYTGLMLLSLTDVITDTDKFVVRRLCNMADVNIKASQHGQTALMLSASQGRLNTVMILRDAGADVNIQDDDGSTALMCAAEHGHVDLIKYFIRIPECDLHITDNEGKNALDIAMETRNGDAAVALYAHMYLVDSPKCRRRFSYPPGGGPPSLLNPSKNSSITPPHSSPLCSIPENWNNSSTSSSEKDKGKRGTPSPTSSQGSNSSIRSGKKKKKRPGVISDAIKRKAWR